MTSEIRREIETEYQKIISDAVKDALAKLNKEERKYPGVELTTPWSESPLTGICAQHFDADSVGIPEHMDDFIRRRTELHVTYIRETAKNERIALLLSFFLIVFASLTVIFAPDGRETISYWVGAAMLIFAAGASGYANVWGKTSAISFGAGDKKETSSH